MLMKTRIASRCFGRGWDAVLLPGRDVRRPEQRRIDSDRRRFGMVLAALVTALLFGGGPARADNIRLTLGVTTVRFMNAHPDLTPSVAALENPVSVRVLQSPPRG